MTRNSKISSILNELTYVWEWETDSKIVFDGEVWIGEINNKLRENNIVFKWCYERGKATYYIGNKM